MPFAASLVVKGWKNSDDSDGDVEVILSGLAALNDEIDWFKKQASKWGVDLSVVAPQQPALDYCRYPILHANHSIFRMKFGYDQRNRILCWYLRITPWQ